MAFTKAQQEAIDHDGNLLMVSGPGSGKTTVSVARALRILQDPERRLIMVTFTREGADEMSKRIAVKCRELGMPAFNKSRLFIGTFHSIAIDHIFRHKPRIPTLSPLQQGVYLRDAMGPGLLADREVSEEVRKDFEFYMHSIDRTNLDIGPLSMEVIEKYKSLLKQARATDLYSVMRGCALEVHKGNIPPLPYTDMTVDEAQDTDDIQKHWIFAHTRSGISTSLVGDDDQSIYEWRHALGYSGMQEFLDTFNAHRIELASNFRCRTEVLQHAVHLVSRNHMRLPKSLVAERGPGGKVIAYMTTSAQMGEELAQIIGDLPAIHQECAILARTNITLDAIEIELAKAQIPYCRIGKSVWDEQIVQIYLVLLQSLVDSNANGLYGVLSFLNASNDLKKLVLQAVQERPEEFFGGKLPASITKKDFEEEFAQIKEMCRLCGYWRNTLTEEGSVNEVVLDVANWLHGHCYSDKQRRTILFCGGLLAKFRGTLSNRLFAVNLAKSRRPDAPVKLMTMHASKGQEFETVHIVGINADEDRLAVTDKEIEAERRLMYVAITRAKNHCAVWSTGTPHLNIGEAKIEQIYQYDALINGLK